jgi:hypothetical protein
MGLGVEILAAVAAACGLGIVSVRYGRDSRDTLLSREHELAAMGFVWDGRPGRQSRRVAPSSVGATHPIRHRLAAGLYRTAEWLHPGVNDPAFAQPSPASRLTPGMR